MLQPQSHDFTIPEETARIATKAFPNGTPHMLLRAQLGVLYKEDADFASLYSSQGKPAESPGFLAMVTAMQYMEGLTDRQAAENVRGRIDWKYSLGLELGDSGFDASVLSEFRSRLIASSTEMYLLDRLLEICKDQDLLSARGQQRTDSSHVLGAVRELNRVELVAETLRHALNALATVEPGWLLAHVPESWFDAYGARIDAYRLPESKAARKKFAETIGQDGYSLFQWIHTPDAPSWLREIPAIETLRQVWVQNFSIDDQKVSWRTPSNMPPCAIKIQSPHDVEVRYSKKRQTTWVGYKVHLTETCETAPDKPNLVTHVHTVSSTATDESATDDIHQALADKQLLPATHFVDAAYVDAENLADSQSNHSVDLFGPAPLDTQWQAKQPDAFDLSTFVIDWEGQYATCPAGQQSKVWHEGIDRSHITITAKFCKQICLACSLRARCTTAATGPRTITLRQQERHIALQLARQRQALPAFKERYSTRAGIEGTISQGVRAFDLRQARYIGLAKTHLQQVFSAVAMNLSRLAEWFNVRDTTKERPASKTRISTFAALASYT